MVWFRPWRQRGGAARAPIRGAHGYSKILRGSILLALIEGADAIGVERARWFHALPMSFEALSRRGARLSWDEFVHSIEALEAAGLTDDDFERMGAAIAGSPHLLLQRFGGFFTRADHLLYIGLSWLGPLLFPLLEYDLDYRGMTITLRLAVPAQLRPCASYFHVCRGTLPCIPLAIGQPKALMSADISPTRAEFRITVLRAPTGIGRLRLLARAVASVPGVIETLAEQERALRQSLEEVVRTQDGFRRVLNALPDGVIVFDDDRIIHVNPELPHLLRYCDKAELGALSWSRLLCDGDDPALLGNLAAPSRPTADFRFRRKDGSVAILELSTAQQIQFEGDTAKLVIARDVTARQAIQNEMAIADRLSSLGMLSAGIAHEINNPLSLILTNLELANRACHQKCCAAARNHVQAAIEGADRVKEITRDLHVFAQPEEEKATTIDVAKIVRSTVVLATGQVKTRARLTTEIEAAPLVMGSEGKLGQVLLNLVINALQALPERPAKDNRITVRLRAEAERVIIEVEDNGAGIPDNVRERLYEPFFSTKQATNGTGLGLAVARGIIVGMSGTLTFESQLHRGTVFRVSLPAAGLRRTDDPDFSPAATHSTQPDCSTDAAPKRVLVIDDEAALRSVLSQLLTEEHHRVVTAANGHQALNLFRSGEQFDVILCDLMMSEGSGVDVYRYLEAEHANMAARVLFMTGGVYRDEVREFLAGINNDCIQKPFSLDEMCQAVARIASQPILSGS